MKNVKDPDSQEYAWSSHITESQLLELKYKLLILKN